MIILGDVNAHHAAWGANKIDNKGTKLNTLFNVIPVNSLNQYDLPTHKKGTTPDLTMASPKSIHKITQWKVNNKWNTHQIIPSLTISDHYPIFFVYGTSLLDEHQPFTTWNIWSNKWNYFRSYLDKSIQNYDINSYPTTDLAARAFTKYIHRAAQNTIGVTTINPQEGNRLSNQTLNLLREKKKIKRRIEKYKKKGKEIDTWTIDRLKIVQIAVNESLAKDKEEETKKLHSNYFIRKYYHKILVESPH